MENPSTHSDLELFTRELTWDTRTTINRLFSPTFFGAMGFGMALAMNYFQRRPMMSGIQRHIALVAIGVPIGMYADRLNENRLARRDAILIHYIRNHPEDFPVTERVKYKDVLDKWLPRR
ncbi:hypothetical protein DAPPUDRAFT_329128 [Daphnia pulex]|uniref:NADH dehydrogenase [ubiquinone] 1 subunit C2 n=1 Tax=Daphnia pulex TaxID=6669 RepID=E9HFR9_DAPPU|nr:hypothetical protein DAPPUDRAFT_329128 [Daphnia pulex]|eukprot:EFX69421.1 hypothetical protein DAPPUDRAFT_329128 [Daphnia pulex]